MRPVAIAAVAVLVLLAGAASADNFDDEFDEAVASEGGITDSPSAAPQADGAETGDGFDDEVDGDADDEGPAAPAPAATPTPAAAPRRANNLPKTWEWEIVALAGVALYIVAFFVGSSVNHSLADAWFKAFAGPGKLIATNFDATKLCADAGSPFAKENASTFRFYASGRAGTRGLIVSLELLPRHDLLSWILAVLGGDEDTVTVEVFMEPDAVAPFVLAVVPRRHRRRVQKGSTDIAAFADVVDSRKVPPSLAALSVLSDAADSLACVGPVADVIGRHTPPLPANRYQGDSSLDEGEDEGAAHDAVTLSRRERARARAAEARAAEAAGAITDPADEPLFRLLHVTDRVPSHDRGVHLLSNSAVRLMCRLPPASRMAELDDLMRASITIADRATRVKLSKEATKRNRALRERLEAVQAEERDAEEGRSAIDDNQAAKRERLERLKRTDKAAYAKEVKKIEKKMIRKRSKVVRK